MQHGWEWLEQNATVAHFMWTFFPTGPSPRLNLDGCYCRSSCRGGGGGGGGVQDSAVSRINGLDQDFVGEGAWLHAPHLGYRKSLQVPHVVQWVSLPGPRFEPTSLPLLQFHHDMDWRPNRLRYRSIDYVHAYRQCRCTQASKSKLAGFCESFLSLGWLFLSHKMAQLTDAANFVNDQCFFSVFHARMFF